MKKFLAALLAAISIIAAVSCLNPASADERILDMDVTGTVSANGEFTVTETLKVRAENREIKRGIIRVFPTDYTGTDSRRYRTEFSLLSAEIDGKRAQTEVTRSGGNVGIRIGDPDVILSRGVHSVSLSYKTKGWIAFRESFDELYWNVTGNDWNFPIDHARFKLLLPDGAEVSRSAAYTGRAGDRGGDYREASGGVIETTRVLMPKEGLTVVYAWNKGIVTPPRVPLLERLRNPVFIAGIVLMIIAYYAIAWYLVGRDPEPRRIIPLYRPPEGVTPGFAHYMKHMKFSNDCVAADIIQLAVLGFVRFSDDAATSNLVITPTDKANDEKETACLPESLAALLSSLRKFHGKNGISVTDANGDIFQKASTGLQSIYDAYADKYFHKNTAFSVAGIIFFLPFLMVAPAASALRVMTMAVMRVGYRVGYIAFGLAGILERLGKGILSLASVVIVLIISLLFASYMFQTNVAMLCGVGVAAAAAFFFSRIMPAYTVKGARTMEEIKGLEMYMGTAERHRLAMLFKPDETPRLFESLLPYAYALGCAETWANGFAETLRRASYVPEWDRTENWGGYNSWTFSNRISRNLSRGITSSIQSYNASLAQSSSSSGGSFNGGSGFGSGGSSGGGGGGGGGGGW